MALRPADIRASLQKATAVKRYWVGYSGGLDSTVLLHLIKSISTAAPVHAIHINHGLHPDAGHWAAHCQTQCAALQIPLTVLQVNARPTQGTSPEAAARHARYSAMREYINPGDCLLTAQHQDDQAETLLLQLLRGSGVDGLAGMAEITPFGHGQIVRPLLNHTRAALLAYAQEQKLRWVEDPSNQNDHYARNFLRNQITPMLKTRWPAFSRVLSRSASLQAETLQLLKELADTDFNSLACAIPGALPVDKIKALSVARRHNLLRRWLTAQNIMLPSRALLGEIEKILHATEHAIPLVKVANHEIRRYRNHLYCLPAQPLIAPRPVLWNINETLKTAAGMQLELKNLPASLQQQLQNSAKIEIRYRQGGERIRLPGRIHHHSVKKLLQEQGIPPWLRNHLPFLYVDNKLIAILGIEPPLLSAR